jgi:hypothetical protein
MGLDATILVEHRLSYRVGQVLINAQLDKVED